MSACGTKRTSGLCQCMSAFAGKADILSAPPYAKTFLSGGVLAGLRTWSGPSRRGTDEHDQKAYSCGRRYGGCDLVLADFVLRQEITQSQSAVLHRGSGLHGQARQGWLGGRHQMRL